MEIKLASGEAIGVSAGGVSLGNLSSDGLTDVKKLSVTDGGPSAEVSAPCTEPRRGRDTCFMKLDSYLYHSTRLLAGHHPIG